MKKIIINGFLCLILISTANAQSSCVTVASGTSVAQPKDLPEFSDAFAVSDFHRETPMNKRISMLAGTGASRVENEMLLAGFQHLDPQGGLVITSLFAMNIRSELIQYAYELAGKDQDRFKSMVVFYSGADEQALVSDINKMAIANQSPRRANIKDPNLY